MNETKLREELEEQLATVENRPLEDLIAEYQEIHGLKVDGDAGPVVERKLLQPRFCAVKDRLSATKCRWDATQWDGTKFKNGPIAMALLYNVVGTYPGMSPTETKATMADVMAAFPRVCAVAPVWTDDPSKANILIKVGKIDGPSSVLAWCELPCGPDTPATQLNALVDQDEPFVRQENPPNGRLDIDRIVRHEMGHGFGLDHLAEGNLMAPYYDPKIRDFQAGDIQELQLRYGPPVPVIAPTPVPPANPSASIVIDLWIPDGTGKQHWTGQLTQTV